MQRPWVPQEMSLPPRLDPELRTSRFRPRYALLINPFYPKDPHADALAIGEGVQLWPRILQDVEADNLQKVYQATYHRPYREDPAPRRNLLPSESFLTTASLIATRGCHNRCGFCYLATDGLKMPYQMRDVDQVVHEFQATGQPYGVFTDNNLGSR